MKIGIIDYGAGNLRSVQNTLDEIGASYHIGMDSDDDRIILPGVGHFGQMMQALDDRGIRGPLLDRLQAGTPFLGICLGLQALWEGSEEAPEQKGLGMFRGWVKRFDAHLRVPHMGWNDLERRIDSKLLAGLPERPYVYFAHSYYVPDSDVAAAICTYTTPYTAVLEHGNLYGVQFHPEKSGPTGLRIIRNFVEL